MERESCLYIYGTSQVYFVECLMSDMKCKLKFYMTSLFNNILNKKKYDCSGSLQVVGSFYLVMYKRELWPGQVTQLKCGGQSEMVKCLEKADTSKGSTCKWPVKKDEHDYPTCDVKQKIETQQLLPGGWQGITFSVLKLSHVLGNCQFIISIKK